VRAPALAVLYGLSASGAPCVLVLVCACVFGLPMVASRDACHICDKPFYGKQKFVRCVTCDLRFHGTCIQRKEADQATATASSKSVFTCDSCTNSVGPCNDKTPIESCQLQSSSSEGALSWPSPNSEYAQSVNSQLAAIRINGQGTFKLVQTLMDMVNQLTNEVASLKSDNAYTKNKIKNLRSVLDASPGAFPQRTCLDQLVLASAVPPTASS
jgi:hypothetical protein